MIKKLKTLKDIKFEINLERDNDNNFKDVYNIDLRDQLKQEAIRWIKKMKILEQGNFCLRCMKHHCRNDNHISYLLEEHSCGDDNAFEISAVIIWIKYFFNIGEEDLKENGKINKKK